MLDYKRLLAELKRREAAARRGRLQREHHSKPSRKWKPVMVPIALFLISAIGYGAKTIIEREPESSNHTAQCRDGTYSNSAHRSGTCSSHGGVRHWINLPEY
jgi:hypothetical protein